MKILYVITKSTEGGAQTHIMQLSRYMIDQGHEVAVMAQPGGWLQNKIEELGGTFFANPLLKNSYNFLLLIKNYKLVWQTIRQFQPDIISCHSGFAGFVVRMIVRNRVPTIFTAHGWSFAPGAPVIQRILPLFAEKLVARFCSKIICVSEYDRHLALQKHVGKQNQLVTIHNAVEEDTGSMPKQETSTITIAFVGRLEKQKNPYVLLRALAQLPQELLIRTKVLFVGDGSEKQQVVQQVELLDLKSQVIFLGNMSRAKVFETLREANIFVLTSNWEGLPRSILEAMSIGLPVIASDVGGIKEIITSETGFVLPGKETKNEEKALLQILIQLIQDSEKRKLLGEAGRRRIQEYFTLDRLYQQTFDVYEQVLQTNA